MLKLSENPPGLFPDVSIPSEIDGKWWVAHTKARAEKAFAWDLCERKVPFFLPMVEHVIFSGGRKRRGLLPLFPSYVFFCGDETARYRALVTDRLSQVIPVVDQDEMLEELDQLHIAIREKAVLVPTSNIAVGRRCRIMAGPFEGLCGTVVRNDGRACIVLRVSLLGQGAMMEIEPELLEIEELGVAAGA